MDYEALLELVKKRRSIRTFKPDLVPDELIQKIIDVALWAPSGADSQPWEFIVIKDPENRMKVLGAMVEFLPTMQRLELIRDEDMQHPAIASPSGPPGFISAPVLIMLCGDTRYTKLYPMVAEAIPGASEHTLGSDLANAFLYMHLAACILGLGSQWITGTAGPYAQIILKQILGIPKELIIYDTMALGYPAEEPQPRPIRNRDDVVHNESYDVSKYRTQEQVNSYIKKIRQIQRR
jgi:nitroreductase